MRGIKSFLWFGIAVGIAGIVFIPLTKKVFAGLANKVGATGAANYIDAA